MKLPKLASEQTLDPVEAASAQVRRYCGWHVAPVITETLRVTAFGGKTIVLPTCHITELTSVLVDGTDVLSNIDWDACGILTLRSGKFPNRNGIVEVELTHGYPLDEVSDLTAVVEQVAKRIELGRRQGADSILQVAGPFTTKRQARNDGQVGGAGFFESEKEILNRYKTAGGVL